MLELMNPVGLEVGEARRREVALETMRAVRASGIEPQQMSGSALMLVAPGIENRRATAVARTESATARATTGATMQPRCDCA